MSSDDVAERPPGHCPPLRVEKAKSSASRCRKCDDKIEQDELRLAFDQSNPDSSYSGLVPFWHHTR